MGELDLLSHVFKHNAALPGRVIIPPGDDMAMLRLGDRDLLITVDQVADGVHVNCADTPLELVGRKAITRNLSDVAAMAALPVGAVVAAALPRDLGDANATRLFDAMRATAERYDCPLVGGDTMIWDGPLTLTVTVFAEPRGVTPVTRSGAKPGDVVCVTGRLGGAWRDGGADAPHLTFEPRIALARDLAQRLTLHSMIDLSDGLATDLRHVCERSHVDAEIDIATMPTRRGGDTDDTDSHGLTAEQRHALCDGEDYELCFTLDARDAASLPAKIDGVPITRIGRIVARAPGHDVACLRLVRPDGASNAFDASGWEHA